MNKKPIKQGDIVRVTADEQKIREMGVGYSEHMKELRGRLAVVSRVSREGTTVCLKPTDIDYALGIATIIGKHYWYWDTDCVEVVEEAEDAST